MASSVTKLHRKSEDMRGELERSFTPQIDDLRKEIAKLSDTVAKLSRHRLQDLREGASDTVTGALHESERALRKVGKKVGNTVRGNPISTIAISAAVAALIAYIARREDWR
jgi:ElaB/YqjD/DUF883 family membrane-anchored ribosome-binding protein